MWLATIATTIPWNPSYDFGASLEPTAMDIQRELMIVCASEAESPRRGRVIAESDFAGEGLWPKYITKGACSRKFSGYLDSHFSDYQFLVVQRDMPSTILGSASSIPLALSSADPLPDEGWDWALAKGVADLHSGAQPNTLCALSITVREQIRRRGIAQQLVSRLLAECIERSFERLIVPARPTAKSQHPDVAMSEYIGWKRADGRLSDPWLRTHVRLGGQIVGVCARSMTVEGRIAEWKEWTGLSFPRSGQYCVPGGLVPVEIDTNRDRGIYVEPNVWIRYDAESIVGDSHE